MLLQIQQAHYKKSFMVEPFITIFTYINTSVKIYRAKS